MDNKLNTQEKAEKQAVVSKSVLLTGKCKDNFEPYCVAEIRKLPHVGSRFFDDTILKEFDGFLETFKNSLMIDFFDNEEFYIGIENYFLPDSKIPLFRYVISDGFQILSMISQFTSRKEAIRSSIIRANELYNEKVV